MIIFRRAAGEKVDLGEKGKAGHAGGATCRGYDETSDSYRYRVIVRAVLIEVK